VIMADDDGDNLLVLYTDHTRPAPAC